MQKRTRGQGDKERSVRLAWSEHNLGGKACCNFSFCLLSSYPRVPDLPCISINKICTVGVIPLAHWTRMLLV